MSRCYLGALILLALALFAARPADAAESYDNCNNTISSLPAVIATQGTWCFKGDLATAITSGSAITVNTNNVTIDCNNFKLGGLAAGLGTSTYGIFANNRFNISVRHCNVRGFYVGIFLYDKKGGAVSVCRAADRTKRVLRGTIFNKPAVALFTLHRAYAEFFYGISKLVALAGRGG